MEKIIIAMGDELKVYLPPMVQPVLKLFMQDSSQQKLVTQKVSQVPFALYLSFSLPFFLFHFPDVECVAAVWSQS